MTRRVSLVAAVLVSVVAALLGPAGGQAGAVDTRTTRLTLHRHTAGLSSPVAISPPYDGSGRMFVAEQGGRVRVVDRRGRVLTAPLLDLTDRASSGGERGVLGLAPHPAYRTNGHLFVFYTSLLGDLRVSRFTAAPGANTIDRGTELVILEIPHRENSNHNGGQLVFGRDGFLYVATGDGGGGGDPAGNAQDLGSLLGKILRIDVNASSPSQRYRIPAGNPFAGRAGARAEIWHYGLRNPWRFSFDPSNMDMWVADVGQNEWEEINPIAARHPGRNLGWDCMEGTERTSFGTSSCATTTYFHRPFWQYDHRNNRCAIVGGHIYRGSAQPLLAGTYVYGDFCSGEIWGLGKNSRGQWVSAVQIEHSGNITTFGVDDRREIYVADTSGTIYRLVAVRR
jgi:glucose/arabinose dehydrogenase